MGDYEQTEDPLECEAMRKMFIGGLHRETKEEVFFEYFGQFGTMVDKVIITASDTKVSRGFGFITYDRADCVEAVFKAGPHIIDGKTLDVKRAMPRGTNNDSQKTSKLFIGGIAPDLTPEALQQYIESRHPTHYGTVDKIDFLKSSDDQNSNKGFGFLECSDVNFADRLTLCEGSFKINGKTMSLKKCVPKEGDGNQGGGRGRGRGRGRGGYVSRGGYEGNNSSYRGGRGGRGGGGQYNKSYQSSNDNGYQQQQYGNDNGYQQQQFDSNEGGGYDSYNQGGYQQNAYGGQQSYGNQDAYGGYNQNAQSGYSSRGGGGARGGYSQNTRYAPY
jgi:RNA recognition motif-containing protein